MPYFPYLCWSTAWDALLPFFFVFFLFFFFLVVCYENQSVVNSPFPLLQFDTTSTTIQGWIQDFTNFWLNPPWLDAGLQCTYAKLYYSITLCLDFLAFFLSYSESLLSLLLLLDLDADDILDLLWDLDFLLVTDFLTLFLCFDFLSPELELQY